jgi:hypothetical protein
LGGVFAKNTSLETKFPSPFGSGNFSSLDWYFSQVPLPNMIYLYKTTFFKKKYCEVISIRILIMFTPEEAEIFKDYWVILA